MFAGSYAPIGWALCEGQLLAVAEFGDLFELISTTFGGDGETTFALPDMRGRIPIHHGNGFILGETGGVEEVTLTTSQIPSHTHAINGATMPAYGANPATSTLPAGNFPAISPGNLLYSPAIDGSKQMAGMSANDTGSMLQAVGGSQPHTNMQPYLCINFIISLYGAFPTQN